MHTNKMSQNFIPSKSSMCTQVYYILLYMIYFHKLLDIPKTYLASQLFICTIYCEATGTGNYYIRGEKMINYQNNDNYLIDSKF